MGPNFGLKEIVSILFKHKYKIVIIFVAVAGMSYFMAARIPITYTTKAVIMVNPGREFVPIPEIGDMRLPAPSQDVIINTEMELITGREISEAVVKNLGVEKLYPGLTRASSQIAPSEELARIRLSNSLQVRNIGRSNLIEVYFRHQDPQTAALALTTLIDRLKERHLQVFSRVNSSFLAEQLKAYEERLRRSQQALTKYKEEHQLLNDEQGGALAKRRDDLENQLILETGRLEELRQTLNSIKSRPGIFFTSGNELRSELNSLRRKEQELGQKYHDGSVSMMSLRDDIRLVEQQLKEHEEHARRAEYLKIESEIKVVQLRIAKTKQQLQNVEGQLLAFNKSAMQLYDLKREVNVNESNYQIYLKKAEEARISENMDQRRMTNISVIQEPSVPVIPDEQQKQKTLRMGLLMALAFSLGTAFAFEFVPQVFMTPDSVRRRLGIPVLATLEHRKAY